MHALRSSLIVSLTVAAACGETALGPPRCVDTVECLAGSQWSPDECRCVPSPDPCAGGACVAECADVPSVPPECLAPSDPPELVTWVSGSSLIARATVLRLHDTSAGVPQNDLAHEVVVRLDTLLLGDAGWAGEEATVVAQDPSTLTVGAQYDFFSQLWLEGQTVGVTEVAHVSDGTYPNLDSEVPRILQELADRRLYDEVLTPAQLVGTGTVLAVRPSTDPPYSEHAPLWAEADVRLDCTLAAPPPSTPATVVVRFASSTDIAWEASPKLTVGEQALFALAVDDKTGKPGPAYLVVDRESVVAPSARAHWLDLLECPPAQ